MLRIVWHIIQHIVLMAIVFIICFGVAYGISEFIKLLDSKGIDIYTYYLAKIVKWIMLIIDVLLLLYAEWRLGKSLVKELRGS